MTWRAYLAQRPAPLNRVEVVLVWLEWRWEQAARQWDRVARRR